MTLLGPPNHNMNEGGHDVKPKRDTKEKADYSRTFSGIPRIACLTPKSPNTSSANTTTNLNQFEK